jgi:phosphoglycolate phosphatase
MKLINLTSTETSAVIFDLDGTLIDSAPSILEVLATVIKKRGFSPAVSFSSSLIGPPLRETLRNLTGCIQEFELDELVSDFKDHYDTEGYKASRPYPGIEILLTELIRLKISLYLATNKRLIPTLKIIDNFGWTTLFNEIYTIDKQPNQLFDNKASMIQALLKAEKIDSRSAIYVGDRIEDFEASSLNDMRAILVGWGYADFHNVSFRDCILVNSPEDLLHKILGHQ